MLDRIHKIAEIVAAFAIVGSLVFVGFQLQQNTAALSVTATQSNTQAWHATALAQATNPQLVEALHAVDDGTASPAEIQQAFMMRTVILKTIETSYHLWIDGHMSDELWAATRESFLHVLEVRPVFEQMIEDWAPRNYTASAVVLFKQLLAEAKANNLAKKAASD
jgi:hypothetical protein